jgi:hypothetical protein
MFNMASWHTHWSQEHLGIFEIKDFHSTNRENFKRGENGREFSFIFPLITTKNMIYYNNLDSLLVSAGNSSRYQY